MRASRGCEAGLRGETPKTGGGGRDRRSSRGKRIGRRLTRGPACGRGRGRGGKGGEEEELGILCSFVFVLLFCLFFFKHFILGEVSLDLTEAREKAREGISEGGILWEGRKRG